MTSGPTHDRAALLRAAQQHLGMTVIDVWLSYVGVGGNEPIYTVGSWLSGEADPGRRDYDLLAQAMNDGFAATGRDHPVPYSEES